MRKTASWIALILIIALLAACSGNSGSSGSGSNSGSNDSGKTIHLTFNETYNNLSLVAKEAVDVWIANLKEKSNGRIVIDAHYSSALGRPNTSLQDISGGVYDMGVILPHYFYDEYLFPITVNNLPFAIDADYDTATKIVRQFADLYKDELFKDIIPLSINIAADDTIFSKTPIRKLDDFKGLRIRTQGSSDSEIVSRLGGSPVTMPLTEIYASMQTGVIDTVLQFNISLAPDMHLSEVAPYMTKLQINKTPVIIGMNRKTHDEMPEDLKKIFDESLAEFQDMYSKALYKSGQESYDVIAKEGEIVEMDAGEREKFVELTQFRWDEWIKDAKARGFDGEKMMQDFLNILQQNGVTSHYKL